ncbi:MAG: penicillin-binding protein 1A [Porticoccaceae bacterium]
MTILLRFFRLCGHLVLPVAGGMLIVTASLYLYLSPKLPSVETLRTVRLQIPLRIYSRDSQLLGEFGEKRRTPVTFEQIPPLFISALLAAEDDNFYSHIGVDIKGLLRATVELMKTGRIQSGGSTITMQLARNFFLSREQSFVRKFNEILLALRIDGKLSKEEILTLYSNLIYLGNRAYGIQAAAQAYYGKPIQELSLEQLAMIAGLPKAPSAFNPIANPARAEERRNWILGRMLKLGYIDTGNYDQAIKTPVNTNHPTPKGNINIPYVAEMARQQTIELVGLDAYSEGLSVTTTLDTHLQGVAQQAVQNGLLSYDQRHGYRGAEKSIPDQQDWSPTLRSMPNLGGLEPAIITKVGDQQLEILLADGTTGSLPWNAGLANLRLYIDENSRSAAINTASSQFKVGDLIRIVRGNDGWRIAQVPSAQAALVALDPSNGAIRALVGGFDFAQSHFNRATQAKRQPGSNFKPFLYSIALQRGFTPASIVYDTPVVFGDSSLDKVWRPENDNGRFYGPISLRKALYLSRNMVSIRLMRSIGVNRAIKGIAKFGFNSDELPRNLSLALGSHALTPLEIVTGYAAFANGGYKIEPFLIEQIVDRDGKIIFRAHPPTVCLDCENPAVVTGVSTPPVIDASATAAQPAAAPESSNPPATIDTRPPTAQRIMDAGTAYMMDSLLKDVIRKGTGRKALALKRGDIAGKTGTTNGPRDAWFSGYNPKLVTTVWLGMDNSQIIGRGEYGGVAALPIWMEFMAEALRDTPESYFLEPEDIVSVRIDPGTGLRAQPGRTDATFELFRANRPPPLETRASEVPGSTTAVPEDIF